MVEGIKRARAVWPGRALRIAAQQRLAAFYASLGFRTVSAPYDEDGIPHVDMLLDAA
jgi:ElaA protein